MAKDKFNIDVRLKKPTAVFPFSGVTRERTLPELETAAMTPWTKRVSRLVPTARTLSFVSGADWAFFLSFQRTLLSRSGAFVFAKISLTLRNVFESVETEALADANERRALISNIVIAQDAVPGV